MSLVAGLLIAMVAGTADRALAAGPLTWSRPVPITTDAIVGIACPSVSLCVAVDRGGKVLTSQDPTRTAASTWTSAQVDDPGALGFRDVSCATITLCVASDGYGNVVASTNPTGGAAAWTVSHIAGPRPGELGGSESIAGVSCPSVVLCVAASVDGAVLTAVNPTGGPAAWTSAVVDPDGLVYDVDCASVALCVGVDQRGRVFTSTNPTGGSAAWTTTEVDLTGGLFFDNVSCPTVTFCAATDDALNVLTSTNPTGGAAAWTPARIGASGEIDCPSPSLCVVAAASSIVASTSPLGGPAAWLPGIDVDSEDLRSVECVAGAFCVAGDRAGRVVVGTPSDATAPHGVLSGPLRQRAGRSVKVTVRCVDEPCTATIGASIKVPRLRSPGSMTFRLKQVKATLSKDHEVAVRLAVGRLAQARINKALLAGKRPRVQIQATVRDAVGNAGMLTRSISLRR